MYCLATLYISLDANMSKEESCKACQSQWRQLMQQQCVASECSLTVHSAAGLLAAACVAHTQQHVARPVHLLRL